MISPEWLPQEIEALEPPDPIDALIESDLRKDLLRFTTAGSVDDGKSTLIGRLLHDANAVYEDQIAAVRKSRINRSGKAIDFSLLTDGLRAEREQGITIDVAYRYFSTPRRKFIIADTPGHEQYTRNMATGASNADLAVILIDAGKGVLPQTRRHVYIASLLGISYVVAAINKMDLISYAEETFLEVERQFLELTRSLKIPSVHCIPISALEGDNVLTPSANMPWYTGLSLMRLLETIEVRPANAAGEFRLPIQYVIRPDARFRGFAGRIASGAIRPGDEVLALPSGRRTTVRSIVSYGGSLDEAIASQSVTLQLADEIDLSRGDMLVSPNAAPHPVTRFFAMLVWLDAQPLRLNQAYLLKHAARVVTARASGIRFRLNISDFSESSADALEMNDIASVEFETHHPLFVNPYRRNRALGSFILIDPLSNATVGAGMIVEGIRAAHCHPSSGTPLAHDDHSSGISLRERIERHGHRPGLFITNRAFAGALERALFERNFESIHVPIDHISPAAFPDVLSALWSAGSVVICSSTDASPNARATVESAGRPFFDLASPPETPAQEPAAILARALELAETLRS